MEQAYIRNIEQIREEEYPQLRNTTYLDHAGTTLYAKSLNECFFKDMASNLFGNPHSASPSSALSTKRVEHVRSRILQFFRADPEHFDVIFVANATAAIKLVMNGFRDYSEKEETGGFWYGYHYDAHTSLVGIRQVTGGGGTRCFRSDSEVEGWLENQPDPENVNWDRPKSSRLGLFAYPAQSNLNGHRPSLDWPGRIRASTHGIHQNVYTLLDAAAYVTTAYLDLSNTQASPDFVSLSFYKIFGFPDLGALIVRKSAGHILRQTRYFGGGTVEMVISIDDSWHAKKTDSLHDELEDGTLPFHSIIALDSAMDIHQELFWSMPRISGHACYLSKLIYMELSYLRHGNGVPVCEVYKHPDSVYGDSKTQGPTIAFNVRSSQGGWIGSSEVEKLAIVRGIQLRTGGVCNPGGIAKYLDLKPWELRRNHAEGMRCGSDFDVLGGKPTGVVRVSLGAMSSMNDVETFVRFIWEVFVDHAPKSISTPAQQKEPRTTLRVQSITLFPIQGCGGCRLPLSLPANIKQGGFALDGEWCIYDLTKKRPLATENYPQLLQLQPTILPTEGLLKIALTGTEKTDTTVHGVTISIWDKPSKGTAGVTNGVTPVPDVYDSELLAEFFTSVMATPCTLARYPYTEGSSPQHQESNNKIPKATQEQILARKPSRLRPLIQNPLLDKFITLSTSIAGSADTNISIAGMDFSPSSNKIQGRWAYLRIGSLFFINTDPESVAEVRKLRYLPNIFDQSPTAQYPRTYAGQSIKAFTQKTAIGDPQLLECLSSLSRGKFVCPVPTCQKDFRLREELDAHFMVHREVPAEEDEDMTQSLESLMLEYEWKRRQQAASTLNGHLNGTVGKKGGAGWRKKLGLAPKVKTVYIR